MWSLTRGGYTPGVATAPFILIATIYLAAQLRHRGDVVSRRGRSSMIVVSRPIDNNSIKWILIGSPDASPPVYNNDLPLLTVSQNVAEREWLESTLTTFARNVASFLPGHYEAYVRIYNPFDGSGPELSTKSWSELAAAAGIELVHPAAAVDFAMHGLSNAQAHTGEREKRLMEPLIENLRSATSTPEHCFFALWEGYGDSIAHHFVEPLLNLPHRAYHVFEGTVEAERTSFSEANWIHRSSNLWWPADRAWFVSTEVDFAWTYVGGSRALIDSLINDPRLDAVETSATAEW